MRARCARHAGSTRRFSCSGGWPPGSTADRDPATASSACRGACDLDEQVCAAVGFVGVLVGDHPNPSPRHSSIGRIRWRSRVDWQMSRKIQYRLSYIPRICHGGQSIEVRLRNIKSEYDRPHFTQSHPDITSPAARILFESPFGAQRNEQNRSYVFPVFLGPFWATICTESVVASCRAQ